MKIEIKNFLTAKVLFECDSESIKLAFELAVTKKIDLSGADLSGAYLSGADLRGAYLREADLSGADLRGAYLSGADLSGADLRGAYLREADLSGADLRGADLSGADLRGADLSGEKLDKAPIQLLELKWDVLITKVNIKIGCQFHSAEQWFKFTNKEISDMHNEALDWWKVYKPIIKALHKEHCK